MHTTTKTNDQIRSEVADAYTVALAQAQAGEPGCCGDAAVTAKPGAEPAIQAGDSCCGPSASTSSGCCGEPAAAEVLTPQ